MGADDKPKSMTDRAKDAVKLAGPAILWFAGLVSEANFPIFAGLAILGFVLVAIFSPYWPTRVASFTDGDGQPIRIPLTPKWVRWVALGFAGALVPLTYVVMRPAKDLAFPMVAIDRFRPSALTWAGGAGYIRHVPLIVVREDGKEYEAHPSLEIEVSARRGRTVRISEVRITAKVVKPKKVMVLVGASFENVVLPNRFRANLSPITQDVTAQMYDDDRPTPGLVVLDEKHPTALLHIEFDESKDGPLLYDVTVEVDVTDGDGNRRVVKIDHPVLISVQGLRPKKP